MRKCHDRIDIVNTDIHIQEPNRKRWGNPRLLMPLLVIAILSITIVNVYSEAFIPDYLISYPETIWEGVSAPVHWNGEDWLAATAILGVGTGLYFLDEDIRTIMQRNHISWLDDVSFSFKQFGEGKYVFPVAGLTMLTGYLVGSDKTLDTGLLCMKSLLISGAVTNTLKYVSQRQRPLSDNGNSFWNGEGFVRRRDSFPSGHATIVWSLAPILAEQYKDKKWVAPAAYTVATLTSLSRVYDDRHWASDAFAAAIVGYFTARLTLSTTPRVQVTPYPASNGIMISIDF